jgi:hypothetical protein
MEVSGQLEALAALPLEKREHATHWIEGRMSPRADLDLVEKRKTFP